MPSAGQSDDCFEVGDLARDELDYLSTLENTLKATLTSAAGGLPGVSIAHISGVMQGHEYCASDPWSYGLSVLLHNDDNLAPFPSNAEWPGRHRGGREGVVAAALAGATLARTAVQR